MDALVFFGISFGLVSGVLFSLLLVSFDKGWKKFASAFLSLVLGGGSLWKAFDIFQVKEQAAVLTSIGFFFLFFLLAFVVFLFIFCIIIKDKHNKDVLRIRDILLGQKNYIEAYYKRRIQEIDNTLNIPALEKRENDVRQRELCCTAIRETLEREKEEFEKSTKKALKVRLPEKKKLVVTKEFLEMFPSYVENLGECIHGINSETKLFLEEHTGQLTYEDLCVYLRLLSMQIFGHLFRSNAKDVRVHFRYYDIKKNGFVKLVSNVASQDCNRDLTFIPCDKPNMIMKSFECRRALIKSYNIDYHYDGKNSTTWTEYMTGAFYNITKNGKPCLSFGISVKSAAKYRHLFNFLNFCKFESYLQEVIEELNYAHSIEAILYQDHTMK